MYINNTISICMLMGNMGHGGVENIVTNYIRHLADKKIEIDIILHENSSFPQIHVLERLNITIFTIPEYSKPISYHKALYNIFNKKRYTILHAHISTMNLFPILAAWRANIPIRISHNHSTAYWGEGIKTIIKYIMRPTACLLATNYFSCGEYAGRWMYGNKFFDSGKVIVVPNAIDSSSYAFNYEDRRVVRAGIGLDESNFVVGHVGRFVYQKNHRFLLNIFKKIKEKSPRAILLLIGEGPLQERIENQAKSLGISDAVIFCGKKSDLGKWYSAMDCFMLPSFYEGLPIVGVEAQANGLPCLFSEAISNEIILMDNAAMLPLTCTETWASRAVEGARCRVQFPESYEISKQAEKLYDIYQKLARGVC